MPQKDYKKIMEENKRKMEEQQNKAHFNIRSAKDRKRVEMEYLDAVKRQMGYWRSQIESTDPEKDQNRYEELKKNIESEKEHIKQIEDELNRINQEIEIYQKKPL